MKWTEKDMQTLIKHYPVGGAKAVLPLLETPRKMSAIGQRARVLGIKMRRHDGELRDYTKYEMTPAILRELRAHYRQNCLTGKTKTLQDIADSHRVSLGWLKYQAGRYGLRRELKRKEWSPEAEAELMELEGMGVASAYKRLRKLGYGYTLQQVASKMGSMGISRVCETGMSANTLAAMLGVDSHVVLRWIRTGALKTQKIKNASGDDYQYHHIAHSAIKRFVMDYKAEVDLRRIDPMYQDLFIDIMTGYLGRGEKAA